MNYKRIYDELIVRGKERSWKKKTAPCYTENHHILPKSMGGNNSKGNLVVLTAREHFIAHWLLYKIHRTQGMAWAWSAMCSKNKHTTKRYTSNNYEMARKALSKQMSDRVVSQETRDKLRITSTGKTHSKEMKAKFSRDRKGLPSKRLVCEHCGIIASAHSKSHFKHCRENPKNTDLFFVRYGVREWCNCGKAIKEILKGDLDYKSVMLKTNCHQTDFSKASIILREMGLIEEKKNRECTEDTKAKISKSLKIYNKLYKENI